MENEQVILGRRVGPEELALVRDLLGSHPDWHRTQLSRELCRLLPRGPSVNDRRGTCYRAAGWVCVGATTGRGRNDPQHTLRVPAKDVYVLALASDFRRRLCA